jgi:hypothetical protein
LLVDKESSNAPFAQQISPSMREAVRDKHNESFPSAGVQTCGKLVKLAAADKACLFAPSESGKLPAVASKFSPGSRAGQIAGATTMVSDSASSVPVAGGANTAPKRAFACANHSLMD